mmetsp:Transcript_27928/g.90042  ORF Transcript_27928/g.90042 Transcript_27928/m.90042 type:complete len:412 (-) Transcript_27928:88-1323(-)
MMMAYSEDSVTSTTRRPRERKFVDDMGQVRVGAQGSAWQGMTYAPLEEKAPPSRRRQEAPEVTFSPTPFDFEGERRRAEAKAKAMQRWETSACVALPSEEAGGGFGGARRGGAPVVQTNEKRATPWATTEDDASSTVLSQRGRRRRFEEPSRREEPPKVRGRKMVSCRASRESEDQTESAMVVLKPRTAADAFGIGNPLARNFVLRQRPATKMVPDATNRKDSLFAAENDDVVYDAKSNPYSRKAFPSQTGGGLSSIGPDLSSTLPVAESRRRVVEVQRPPERPERPGRKLFPSSKQEQQQHGDDDDDSAAEATDSLGRFCQWYRDEYGDEPPRAALERAAQHIVESRLSDREEKEPSSDKPETTSPPRDFQEEDERRSAFVQWYEAKYDAAPPTRLVDRAAKTFAIGDRA